MRGLVMLDQISLSSRPPPLKYIKLLHFYKELDPTNQEQQLKKYLHSLTFDIQATVPCSELSHEDVYRLKDVFNRLYGAYKAKICSLNELEGVWPLLTFSFSKIAGIQLYLAFENLIEPVKQPETRASGDLIKQEHIEFNPKGYFQNNNEWINDKPFLKAIRVLEPKKLPSTEAEYRELLQIIVREQIELSMQCRQYESQQEQFKKQFQKVAKEKKAIKNSQLCNVFEERLNNLVLSDPGNLENILKEFDKPDYFWIHSYTHPELLQMFKHKSKSVNLIKDDSDEEDKEMKNQKTKLRTFHPKRRLSLVQWQEQIQERRPRQLNDNYGKRHPRHKVIEKMYDIEPKKNMVYQDFKARKAQEDNIRRIKNRRQDCVRKKIKQYGKRKHKHSDDEGPSHRSANKRSRRINEDILYESQIDIIQSISSSSQQQNDSSQSQAPTMKRHRATKLQPVLQPQPVQPRRKPLRPLREENLMNLNKFSDDSNSKIFLQSAREIINKKCNQNSFYLKKSTQEEPDGRQYEEMQNLQIRKLNLDSEQQLMGRININHYFKYLQSLTGKEIKKQIMKVSKELLLRQKQIAVTDMLLKTLGLFILGEMTSENQWKLYQENYIIPMLRHSIFVNLYACLSDILNNLSVSAFNEDLTLSRKIKKVFTMLHEITKGVNSSECQLSNKLLSIIYGGLTTFDMASRLFEKKYSTNDSYIVFDNPLNIGTGLLKFKMKKADSFIAFIISSLIFEQTVLRQLDEKQSQSLLGQYKSKISLELYRLKSSKNDLQQKSFDDDQSFLLTSSLKHFHITYKPAVTQQYFISTIQLINISLERLNSLDGLGGSSKIDRQIGRHSNFLDSLCQQFLEYQLAVGDITNPMLLLNILTKQTGLGNQTYKIIKSPKKLTMILYTRVLTIFWQKQTLRQPRLYENTLKKHLEHIRKNLTHDGNNIIIFSHPKVAQAIFQFLFILYDSHLRQNLCRENQSFRLPDEEKCSRFVHSIKAQGQLRSMIMDVFTELDRIMIRQFNVMKVSKNVNQPENFHFIEQTLTQFLDTFIRPEPSQDSIIQYSVSHHLFILQFILNQSCLFKYFSLKLPFQSKSHTDFLQKCLKIVDTYFQNPPNLKQLLSQARQKDKRRMQFEQTEDDNLRFQKHCNELNGYFYLIVREHWRRRNAMQKQQENCLFRESTSKRQLQTVSRVYGMYLLSSLEIEPNLSLSEHPLLKAIQQTPIDSLLSPQKISKAIYSLDIVLHQLLKANQISQTDSTATKRQKSEKLKHFYNLFILKVIKEITIIIVLGFALKEVHHQELYVPLMGLLDCLQQMQLVNKQDLQESFKEQSSCAYLHFIYALQSCPNCTSLAGILLTFKSLFQKQMKLTAPLGRMLIEIQMPLKRLLLQEPEKSDIVLQNIKLLTFGLAWSEINVQVIKKYLRDSQIILNGNGLITKIDISQSNILELMRFFQAIEQFKYDYYQMKGSMDTYVDLVCSSSSSNNERFYKNVHKLLLCLSQILRENQAFKNICFKFLSKVLQKFTEPILKWSLTQSLGQSAGGISRRVTIFAQMMKRSRIERPIYENVVVNKRQDFEKSLSLLRQRSLTEVQDCCPYTFEKLVQQCMISPHSDMLQIKAMLSSMIRQGLNQEKRQFMKRILGRMTSIMEGDPSKEMLMEWCQQEIQKLRQKLTQVQQLSSWMDLQDSD